MLKRQKSKDESGAKKIQKNMLFKIRAMYFLQIERIKDEVPGDTKEMLKNDKKNIFGCCVFCFFCVFFIKINLVMLRICHF